MENQAYISRVHLKGYKSIRDMEIDFMPGLNIIIGPNGSGKTNFLEFLHSSYNAEYKNLINNGKFGCDISIMIKRYHESLFSLQLSGSRNFSQRQKKMLFQINNEIFKDNKLYSNIATSFNENKTIVESKEDITELFSLDETTLLSGVAEDSVDYKAYKPTFAELTSSIYLRFENPLNTYLKETMNLKISFDNIKNLDGYSDSKNNETFNWIESSVVTDSQNIGFIQRIFGRTIIKSFSGKEAKNIVEQLINEELVINPSFKDDLARFSPIKDVKIDWEVVRKINSESGVLIENIYFLFYVNNSWLSWSQLSDGTKRLFYIIGNVFYSKPTNILFVEEPELGIHPDQLFKLMDFLNEQSKEKQIIITTHSPEVLNILGNDELDRIIVTRYDAEKGTQMHHLSPKQIRKGQIYIEETGDLKSFWVHSNLEEYEGAE